MHIHILGICGTFMGGIAALARATGHRVTGCDTHVYPPMSEQLEAQKITLIEGFTADQVNIGADIFVIGNIVSRGNPLMEEILNRGLPYTSGPQWLAEHVLKDKWVLAVAGTHGKTTTASMLAWILEDAGMNPGFLIGGVPQNFDSSARLGASPFFVIEADEYDTAFFDKRSKFVHYRPRTAILNNLEFDHADIFSDLAAIQTQFHHLLRTLPSQGRVIVNSLEQNLDQVLKRGCWSEIERFNSAQGWQTTNVNADNGFDVMLNGETQAQVQWSILGSHNRSNALAAIAAARHIGVTPRIACAAMGQFINVKRRMENRGSVNNITIYDDFAHHPTAISTTIAGLRTRVGNDRILAVLEPRSNTMKLGTMKMALPDSLTAADLVFCYSNNLEWDPAEVLASLGKKAITCDNLDNLIGAIVAEARPQDHILVMSNGSFGDIHNKLLTSLAE